MRESYISLIIEFLKRHLAQKRWRRTAICMAAVVVFCTTYFLMLPAISMTKHSVSLGAETLSAWSGDPLSVRVTAWTEEDEDGKIFTLVSKGAGAELSETYVFDEDGICVITDEEGREIELHRAFRADKKTAAGEDVTADYWFTLEGGEQTAFTLQLSDEVDAERFLRAAEAVKSAAAEADAAAEKNAEKTATGSDADRKEEKTEQEKATGSNGQRAASGPLRAASVSDAVKAEETEEEDGFVQLLDGEVLNDLAADVTDEEPTETVAFFELCAGSGKDLSEAVRDAEKNADKRGDGRLKFVWKDIAESVYITPEMIWTGDGAQVAVIFDGDAKLPADAVLSVEEIEPGTPEYEAYLAQAVSVVRASGSDATKEMGVDYARFFDICILDGDGNELEPAAPVKVVITYDEAVSVDNGGDLSVMHFHEENTPEVLEAEKNGILRDIPAEEGDGSTAGATVDVDALSFTAEKFSVFGVVRSAIEKLILASDGQTYRVSVSCGAGSCVPEGAELSVSEITEGVSADGKSYDDYVTYTQNALGMEEGSFPYIRLFDISIVKDGEKIQPAEGSSVGVRIELADKNSGALNVIHFADGSEEGKEVLSSTESTESGSVVEFRAESFSVYSIVEAPEPAGATTSGWNEASSLDEIEALGGDGFYVSYNKYYLTGDLVHNVTGNSDRDGLDATEGQHNTVPEDLAAKFYFIRQEGTDKFKIYTDNEGGTKNYVKLTSVRGNNSRAGLTFVNEESEGTAFTVEKNGSNNSFYISAKVSGGTTEYWWNRNGNDPGAGAFVAYKDKNDKNSAKVVLSYYTEAERDPYKLDGRTFGIAYNNNSASAAALSATATTVNDQDRLEGVDLLIRPDVLNNTGILLVAQNSSIQEWTFESIEADEYYIKTTAEGTEKFLCIDGGKVTLVDSRDDASKIKARPGTGANSGKWHFTVSNYSLNYTGSAANGFNAANNSNATAWLNLVVKSDLSDDDFTLYSAKKVSVSDNSHVYSGQQVVIYTRSWNDSTKKYEFYAVNHDGALIRCYDTGDNIEWIGSNVNYALWTFTEGHNDDGTLSYYYWLENTQYANQFLVPQVTNGQVIYNSTEPEGASDFSASVNLNGRRYGGSYTPIICWDDQQYSYSGFKVENGHIVPCALAEADDFYFAVMNPADTEDHLTTVNTIDNAEYGITMKMIDFNNPLVNERDSVQHAFFGNRDTKKHDPGLLSTNLDDPEGYPTTTLLTGHEDNLSVLYNDMTDVNHLFIDSIHNESGYFEFDSTQNFASRLDKDGNVTNTFTVYDQIAAIGTATGPTRTHGQFMPFNKITEGRYAFDNKGNPITNQTNVLAAELADTDPRKGEKLYSIPQNEADYFFGMEMTASFTQTASGLDAWGHDIVFEFSGDDDFWLYVDGEQVLDLGGVRPAMAGSINFRTGQVNSGGNITLRLYNPVTKTVEVVSRKTYTLREVFESNFRTRYYKEKGEEASLSEVNAFLAEYFEDDSDIFKNYTTHTMRMFYMERGSGASNLHMRFNLAAVKPGTVELSKKLSGTDSATNNLLEFPYQVYYYSREDGETEPRQLCSETDGTADFAEYKDTVQHVAYKKSFTAANGAVYDDVLFLKPGETAVIDLPEGVEKYYIVECAVDPNVYDTVTANGVTLVGRDDTNPQDPEIADTGEDTGRKNFSTSKGSSIDRPSVEYDNHVAEGAMRTLNITKKLFNTDGVTLLHYDATEQETEEKLEDKTVFEFRLYLGNENADPDNLAGAYLYPYFVKNRAGYYCQWDAANNRFRSLEIDNFEDLQAYLETLSAVEKETIVFTTSPNGSISKIPADYTVEVRDLIIGTQWKSAELDREIPRGYTRRESDGYARVDQEPAKEQPTPISGTMAPDESPAIEIRNQRGWGLTAEKYWTDKDFMSSHDTIYFAVYVHDSDEDKDDYALVPEYVTETVVNEDGTTITNTVIDHYKPAVRELTTNSRELYYFFGDLRNNTDKTYQFSDYFVREVSLAVKDGAPEGTSIEVDAEGYVTNLEKLDVTRIGPDETVKTLTTGGTPAGGEYQDDLTYTVSYTVGSSTGENKNIRTDTVTNSRPGIELYKTDWSGAWISGADGKTTLTGALAGASFTLKDIDGDNVAASSYTSGSDGLITIAYLSPSQDPYILTETVTPANFVGLDHPVEITVNNDGSLVFTSGTDTVTMNADGVVEGSSSFFTVQKRTGSGMDATVTIKNRGNELEVVKVEGPGSGPQTQRVQGAHFALYHQVKGTDGKPRKDYQPISGYEDLVTGQDGIPVQTVGTATNKITMALPAGTYYLEETQAAEGYEKLGSDLCFTLGRNGTVTINSAGHEGWLTSSQSGETGVVTYTIAVPNQKVKKVSLKKVDIIKPLGTALEGAKFKLYLVKDGVDPGELYIDGLVSDAEGMLSKEDQTVFELPAGTYRLVETEAPAGYIKKTEPVEITVNLEDDTEDKALGETGTLNGMSYDEGTTLSGEGTGIGYTASTRLYTILISNTAGVELPHTGGPGTRAITLTGALLTAAAGALFLLRRRNKKL